MSANTNIELLGYTDDELEAAFFDRFDDSDVRDMCYSRDIYEQDAPTFEDFSDRELEDELIRRDIVISYATDDLTWLETYLRSGDLINATAKIRDMVPLLDQYNVTLTKA